MILNNVSTFSSFGLIKTFFVVNNQRVIFSNFFEVNTNSIFQFHSKSEFFKIYNFFKKKKLNKAYSVRMFLKGVGYKILKPIKEHYKGYFKLDLGYSVIMYINVPFYIKLRHARDRFVLFSFNQSKLNMFAKFLHNLRVPDVYKGKGVRYTNLLFMPKPGKQR